MNDCILMVDDDPEDIILVKTALKRTGLPVSFVALPDGESLLHFVEQNLTLTEHSKANNGVGYLVLLDLNMPKMDGRLCLSKLREIQCFEALPVVMFSTSDAYDDVEKSYAVGANSYICKPDNVKELEAIMDAICRFWIFNKARWREE